MEITTRQTKRSHSLLFKVAVMGRGKPTDRWGGDFAPTKSRLIALSGPKYTDLTYFQAWLQKADVFLTTYCL